MNTDTATQLKTETPSHLGGVTAAFGWAAAATILFNTVLACAKDFYSPLNAFMKSLTGHHWITHGLADIALFFGLGLIFWGSGLTSRTNASRLIAALTASVLVASAGLIGWYLLF